MKNNIPVSNGLVLIANLVRWEGNPRSAVTPQERAELKASIADKGVLTPIVIRSIADNKYEVIAGNSRRACIEELAQEGLWPANQEVPHVLRDDLIGDDASALDVAQSENIHIPSHPMDQFTAFMNMVEMGKDPAAIATAYGVTKRIVEQRLAYAKLDPKLRQMVRDGERDIEWASAMTMASLDEQTTMIAEMEIDTRRYTTSHDVRRRLEDELVPVDYALFDTAGLSDSLVRRDLFDDKNAKYLKRSEFLVLQDQAVIGLVDERRAEGWARVTVINEREFDRFKYNDGIQDKTVAEVILVRHPSGKVSEHAGLALRIEERINDVHESDEEAGEALFSNAPRAQVRAEALTMAADAALSNEGRKTARYMAISKTVVSQAVLATSPKLALAVAVAGMVMSSAPKPLDGRVFGEFSEIDEANPSRQIVEGRLDAVREIMEKAGIDPTHSYEDVIDILVGLPDDQLMTLFQVNMAMRVTTDMPRGNVLFDVSLSRSGRPLSDFWRPDRSYLSTLPKIALEGLAKKLLPARLVGGITGSRDDMAEALSQRIEAAHVGDPGLREEERDQITSWAPQSLGGASDNDMFAGIASNDDAGTEDKEDAEAAIFG